MNWFHEVIPHDVGYDDDAMFVGCLTSQQHARISECPNDNNDDNYDDNYDNAFGNEDKEWPFPSRWW